MMGGKYSSVSLSGQDDDDPDIVGIKRTPVDTWQREVADESRRQVFHLRRRKGPVWVWDGEHIQNQTLSDGQSVDSIPLIMPVGK